jgi:serine/threonine protein phosphatase PrpC
VSGVVLRAGGVTDVGRLRTINQDSFVLLPDRDLFIVADGMGGHQGGEVASRLAIETLQVAYQDRSAEALTEAIAVANHRIRNEGDADPDLRGMGTTLVALAILAEEPEGDVEDADADADTAAVAPTSRLLIANVGDSRGYLYRDDSLVQLTEDHSVVADLVREGRITAEEAEVHPQRNIVTRVLGVYESVEADLWPVDPIENDRYLLCSDGLFNEVGSDQICSVLRRLADPTEAAAELVRLANEGGGRDNITAVVVDVVDDGGVAAAASSAIAADESGLEAGPAPAPASGTEDPAGFTTALPLVDSTDPVLVEAADEAPPPKLSRKERRAAAGPRTRFTWRAVGFVVLVLAVIGGALATIQWYGTSTYFVAFDGEELVIYKGRPDGILWIEPELAQRTDIQRAEVPARFLPRIDAGNEQPTLAKAQQLVANIEAEMDGSSVGPPDTSSTTTTSSTSSSTSTTAGTTSTQAN